MAVALQVQRSEESGKVVLKSIADEVISALKLVYLSDSSKHIRLADPTDYAKSQVIGITLQAGTLGNEIKVLTFGILEDSFFNFPLNIPLYLGMSGTITSDVPTSGMSVRIGHSLGSGAIYLQVQRPTILT